MAKKSLQPDYSLPGATKIGEISILTTPSEAADDLVRRILGLTEQDVAQIDAEIRAKKIKKKR